MKLTQSQIVKIIREELALLNDDAIFKDKDIPGDHDHDHSGSSMMPSSCSKCGSPLKKHVHHQGSHSKNKHSRGSSYMARPQLLSILKNTIDLLRAIKEGEEISDWSESHISQAYMLIDQVHKSIDYKSTVMFSHDE